MALGASGAHMESAREPVGAASNRHSGSATNQRMSSHWSNNNNDLLSSVN